MSSSTSEIPRQTIQEVKRRLDQGEAVFLLDVHRHPDNTQMKGAVYYNPEEILSTDRKALPVPKNQPIITYCT